MAQVKTMNLLAKQHEVTLDEKEEEKVKEAAHAYYAGLNETEIRKMDISEETIEKLYAEYALADKVYEYIIKDINPEISDDEARTITVEHILIKTYTLDGAGKKFLIRIRQRRQHMKKRKKFWRWYRREKKTLRRCSKNTVKIRPPLIPSVRGRWNLLLKTPRLILVRERSAA